MTEYKEYLNREGIHPPLELSVQVSSTRGPAWHAAQSPELGAVTSR